MHATAIDEYWAGFFGVPTAVLGDAGRHVVPHKGLTDYHGAWVFTHLQTVIVSVPRTLLDRVRHALDRGPWPQLAEEPEWRRIFGVPVAKVIGPAYDGFVRATVVPKSPHAVRRLRPDDHFALERLRACCVGDEWEHASIDPQGREPVFGCFVDGELAGAAQNKPKTHAAVSPGIVTSPAWRRRGVGAAVLAAAVDDASKNQRLLLYQTLLSNLSAVRLGESLGVVPYAEHVAYRFVATGSEG